MAASCYITYQLRAGILHTGQQYYSQINHRTTKVQLATITLTIRCLVDGYSYPITQ